MPLRAFHPHISIFSQDNCTLSQDASFGVFFVEPIEKKEDRDLYLLQVGENNPEADGGGYSVQYGALPSRKFRFYA